MMEVLDVPKFGDTKLFVKKMEKRMRSRKKGEHNTGKGRIMESGL